MKQEYFTKTPFQTKKLGEALAEEIIKLGPAKRAFIVGLIGDLGGGKTTFLQGAAKGLGVKNKVLSPTFVLIKRFPIPDSQFSNFYHIDCYRAQKTKDISGLDFKDLAEDPENIIAVEWADKIKNILPKNALFINFDFIDEKTRKITISA